MKTLAVAAVALLAAFVALSQSATAAASGEVGKIRWAYHITYDATSLTSLRQHIGQLDYLSPYFYEMDGNGDLRLNSGATSSHIAEVRALARANGVKLLPMVKNSATWDAFTPVLADPSRRAHAIANLVALALDGYDGVHVDFENVNAADRPQLTAFMAELAGALRSRGKLVTQAVPAKDRERTTGWAGAYDYAALAPSNDLIVLMAYGYGTAVPQSTAPIGWVEGSATYAASQFGAAKVVLGVPWYGYHWNATTGSLVGSVRYEQAMALVQGHGAAIQYDSNVEGAHFDYWEGGQRHTVWFEDRRSLDAKLDLVFKYGLIGAAGWRLGHEDPAVWAAFDGRLGLRTWLLAEGCTARPYHTWVLIMNPNDRAVQATVTFMKEDGGTVVRRYGLAPRSRFSIFANDVVPDAAISTLVEADGPVLVERAMYFGHDGHVSAGVNAPSRRWFLPEGRTDGETHTWVLLMNPNGVETNVTVTFLREDGPPVSRRYQLRPTSRLNVFANQIVPNGSFATLVEADAPIVAERATYFDGGKGGHGSVGSPFAAKEWYFAEGYTGYDSWLLLMNANSFDVGVNLRLTAEDGREVRRSLTMPPTSRRSVHANDLLPNAGYAARITADAPIVAERSMYWGEASGGHAALGSPAPAKTWFLAEGCTAYPFDEWVLILNPNAAAANVSLTFMPQGGENIVRGYTVGGNARFTLHVDDVVPNDAVSIRVDADRPVVVERSMYFGEGGTSAAGVSR